MYEDCDGNLTQYLRNNCTGGFPDEIAIDHDFAITPIEYYLEVKTTTTACSTRFYLSTLQYERVCTRFLSLYRVCDGIRALLRCVQMQKMALRPGEVPSRVYVIMRVYDITSCQAEQLEINHVDWYIYRERQPI